MKFAFFEINFNVFKTDELVGDYIEFVEGDNISLLCNTPDKMRKFYIKKSTGVEYKGNESQRKVQIRNDRIAQATKHQNTETFSCDISSS